MVHIQDQDRAPVTCEDCGNIYTARICPDNGLALIGVTSCKCGGTGFSIIGNGIDPSPGQSVEIGQVL